MPFCHMCGWLEIPIPRKKTVHLINIKIMNSRVDASISNIAKKSEFRFFPGKYVNINFDE